MRTDQKNAQYHTHDTHTTSYGSIIESMAEHADVPLFDAQVRTDGCKSLEDIYPSGRSHH